MECADFLQFQDAIKRMRDVDDKLVYSLNVKLPTPSFKSELNPSQTCEELFNTLQGNYDKRERAIRGCIEVTKIRIKDLREKRESGDELAIIKQLNKEQTKLRLLQSELNVEEVVKGRSFKLFYERCRTYFKPPNLNFS